MAMASKMNAPTNIQTVILPVLTCIQTAIALLYQRWPQRTSKTIKQGRQVRDREGDKKGTLPKGADNEYFKE